MSCPAVSIPHQLIADYKPGLQVGGFSRLLTVGALPLALKSDPHRVYRQICRSGNLPVAEIPSQANFVDLIPALSWAPCIDTTSGAPPWAEGLISYCSSLAIVIQVCPSERRNSSLFRKRKPARHKRVFVAASSDEARLNCELKSFTVDHTTKPQLRKQYRQRLCLSSPTQAERGAVWTESPPTLKS